MTWRNHMFPILAAALVFLFVSPITQHGQLLADDTVDTSQQGTASTGDIQTVNSGGSKVSCSTIPEAQGGVLLGYIIPCVTSTIGTTTQNFSAKMIDYFMPLFYAFLTFVIVIFGVEIAQGGQRDIHKKGFLLLLKIALVIGIFQLIPTVFVPSVYGIMSQCQTIIANALGPEGSSLHCNVAAYGGGQTLMVWKQMDCVMGKIYGFTSGSGGGHNMFLAASVFGALTGFLFGGVFGLTIFFMLIGVLVSLFLLVMRTAVAFVSGYLLVCVMLLISPFFLPLILMKVTSSYFEPWWKNIFAGFMMPILVSSYAMLSLILYDALLFAPDSQINKLFDYSFMQKAEQLPQQACDRSLTNDPTGRRSGANATDAQRDTVFQAPQLLNPLNSLLSGANSACGGFQKPNLDLVTALGSPASAKAFGYQLFQDCLKLIVLGFLITAGFKTVENTIRPLSGASGGSGLLGARTKSEKRLEQAYENAQTRAKQSMQDQNAGGGGASGAEFVRRAPGTMQEFTRGFFDGLSK